MNVIGALNPLKNNGERIGGWGIVVVIELVHIALHNAAAHNARQCCVSATVACVETRIGEGMREHMGQGGMLR